MSQTHLYPFPFFFLFLSEIQNFSYKPSAGLSHRSSLRSWRTLVGSSRWAAASANGRLLLWIQLHLHKTSHGPLLPLRFTDGSKAMKREERRWARHWPSTRDEQRLELLSEATSWWQGLQSYPPSPSLLPLQTAIRSLVSDDRGPLGRDPPQRLCRRICSTSDNLFQDRSQLDASPLL